LLKENGALNLEDHFIHDVVSSRV